jgi:rhodanese-related sulfurtransferase
MSLPKDIQHLSPAEVASAVRNGGVTIVDVREPPEFAAEHIEGALLFPLSRFNPGLLPGGKLIFQCGSGKRSLAALQRCHDSGLDYTAHLAGGLQAWKQAGLPTSK